MSVYAIKGRRTQLVKIGVSEDPVRRLASLQSGSPDELVLVATCDGGYELEQKLHTHLAKWRRHGEWFAPSSETCAVVGAIVLDDLDSLNLDPVERDRDVSAFGALMGDKLDEIKARAMAGDRDAGQELWTREWQERRAEAYS